MGYPSALSAKTWGFEDVLVQGQGAVDTAASRQLCDGNILFKISYPAEFHAQTAVEAAMTLHGEIAAKIDDIERIVIETQEPGAHHRQDRAALQSGGSRHCIQYMVRYRCCSAGSAPPTTKTKWRAIRASMPCARRCRSGRTPGSRRITTTRANAITATPCRFSSRTGGSSRKGAGDYPIGHRKRREEGIPVLVEKFESSVAAHFGPRQTDAIKASSPIADSWRCPVNEFVAALVTAS